MAIDSKHPKYTEYYPEWIQLRDIKKGERAVKDRGVTYLPATAGMEEDGMGTDQLGYKDYQRYKARARVPNFVRRAVEKLVGIMHQKDPSFKLPKKMESLLESASVSGESLKALLRRINTEQILVGRIGLLADFPENPTADQVLPYIATYNAETMINWNEDTEDNVNTLKLVVLDETREVINAQFEWEVKTAYRLLMLNAEEGEKLIYKAGVFTNAEGQSITFDAESMVAPSIRGTYLEEIPFVFINALDTLPDPDDCPLTDLGNLVLAIYRGEADYRQTLFMQGQDTLVVIAGTGEYDEEGNKKELRVGSGTRIDVDVGGDAKYIGVSSSGLSEQREALTNDKLEAEEMSGSLISPSSGKESGTALNTRITARTATLNQIALTGALGLQKILRLIARWLGEDPNEVEVIPNIEFADFELGGAELVQLMTAKAQGAPLSLESIHAIMVERGITKFTYEDEKGIMEEEAANSFDDGTGGIEMDPIDQEDDPNADPTDDTEEEEDADV